MRQPRPRWANSAALPLRLWVAVAIKSKGRPIPSAMGPTTGMFGKWVMYPERWPEQLWSALGRVEAPGAENSQGQDRSQRQSDQLDGLDHHPKLSEQRETPVYQ